MYEYIYATWVLICGGLIHALKICQERRKNDVFSRIQKYKYRYLLTLSIHTKCWSVIGTLTLKAIIIIIILIIKLLKLTNMIYDNAVPLGTCPWWYPHS